MLPQNHRTRNHPCRARAPGGTFFLARRPESRAGAGPVVRIWKEYVSDPIAHSQGITPSLEEWLRETLARLPPSAIRLETNLGGLDEAGGYSPDFDWAGMVAVEFPAHRIEVVYLPLEGAQERATPYFVRLEIAGTGVIRAEVRPRQPGTWAIYEDP